MASLAEVFVDVRPETKNFDNDLKKKLGRIDAREGGGKVAKSFGGGFTKGLGRVLKIAGGLFVGAKIFSFFKKSTLQAEEAASAIAITNQVLEQTGGAANVSSKGVDKLTRSLALKTGVDKTLVRNGSNILLTFKNIRNEAGKGNDVFDRANGLALDLAATFKTDVKSTAIQLGKALDNPIKGITALTRSGVTFTEKEKEKIKTLQESGDTLGAQQVILKALDTQVGGTAEASADSSAKIANAWREVREAIGRFLLPILDKVAKFVVDKALPAFQDFGDFAKRELIPRLKDLGDFAKRELIPRLKDLGGFIRDEVIPVLVDIGEFIRDEVVPRLVDLAKWIGRNKDFFIPFVAILGAAFVLFKAFTIIKTVVVAIKAWTLAQYALNGALLANPIGLIVVAIAALVAGLIVAYKKSETFRDIVDGVFSFIADAADSFWNGFLKPIFDAFGGAIEWIGDTAETLKQIWDLSWEEMKSTVKDGVRFIVDGFLGFVDTILQGAEQAFGWVPGVGDKLDDAHDAFSKFRADVNRELSGINDEKVNINVGYAVTGSGLPAGLTRGGSGGRGSRGGAGAFANIPARDIEAMGGDLDLETLGLDPGKITSLATDFVSRTRAAITKAAKAATATLGPGAGRFIFPLPRGSYRVGVPINGYPGHTGQDFPAARGTPVYAPFSGYLLARNLGNRSYGRFADIAAGAWRSIQAHLSGFARGSGPVRAGQLVGYVGSTGNSTGNHLHQEFRRNGAVVNPRSVLSYAHGGIIGEHVIGVGMRSGRPYQFGERGPETVSANGEMQLADVTIRKLGDAIGRVVLGGIGSAQHLSARSADLYGRTG